MAGTRRFSVHFYPGQPHTLSVPMAVDPLDVFRGLRQLGEDAYVKQFTDISHEGSNPRPSKEAFVGVVRCCLQAGRSELCKMFLMVYYNQFYMEDAQVVGQVVEAVRDSRYHHLLSVVCERSEPEVALDEKLSAIWSTKRLDLLDACFDTDRYDFPRMELFHLSLDTAKVVLEAALEGSSTSQVLDCVIRVARVTDFLMCVLRMGRHKDPPVQKVVDHVFLNTDVKTLMPEQIKLLWMCTKREVVFARLLLQAALKGQVCPLPRSLELLGTLNEVYFGVLDVEFLAPLFSTSSLLRCPHDQKAASVRDVVILLIRSGLLHQYGAWLEDQLEECLNKACPGCQYCEPNNYLVSAYVPDSDMVQWLLLESGFLPHKLLMRMPRAHQEEPEPQQPQQASQAATNPAAVFNVQLVEPGSDVYRVVDVSTMSPDTLASGAVEQINLAMGPRAQRPPPSPWSQKTLEVIDTFIKQPYSLMTQIAAQLSTRIGCHCGRTERINKLPLPTLLKDRVAFKGGHFKLSREMELEERMELNDEIEAKDRFNVWLHGNEYDYEFYQHLFDDDDDDDDDFLYEDDGCDEAGVGGGGDAPPSHQDGEDDDDVDDSENDGMGNEGVDDRDGGGSGEVDEADEGHLDLSPEEIAKQIEEEEEEK